MKWVIKVPKLARKTITIATAMDSYTTRGTKRIITGGKDIVTRKSKTIPKGREDEREMSPIERAP